MSNEELQKKIVETALKYVGMQEIKGNLGWTSESFEAKMVETGWKTTQAWCAYFTELVWSEVYDPVGLAKDLDRYFSGSARRTLAKFAAADGWCTGIRPVPGAVVIWKSVKNGKDQSTGHAGIVVEVHKDHIVTVEGNTNAGGSREGDAVAKKTRKLKFTGTNGLVMEGFVCPRGITCELPFANKEEGDAFRAWVNDTHPEYARKIDLDRSGSHSNSYILKAYDILGKEYDLLN
jgi:hypothetical protein